MFFVAFIFVFHLYKDTYESRANLLKACMLFIIADCICFFALFITCCLPKSANGLEWPLFFSNCYSYLISMLWWYLIRLICFRWLKFSPNPPINGRQLPNNINRNIGPSGNIRLLN